MAVFNVDVQTRSTVGAKTYVTTQQYSGTKFNAHRVLVPNQAVDLEVPFAVDVSAIKNLFIRASRDLTLETNADKPPGNIIQLRKDTPLIWNEHAYFDCPLDVDVVGFFFTNPSGYDAMVEMEVLE